jgi:superfamily II DNA or RNA helicase
VKKLCLADLTLLDRYATNRNDLVAEFYGPCLACSTAYDRAVGYFRSSILLLSAQAAANFAMDGGKIRLICSPELADADIEALEKGYEWRDTIGEALLRAIEQALADPHGRTVVEFLATLVAVGCLDIRIAFRPRARGIFHDKVGIFHDDSGHSVSFTGSSNETFQAWDSTGNHESFDVFRSWTTEASRVQQHAQYFESLWSNNEPGIETIPFPQVPRDRLVAVANPDGIGAAFENLEQSRPRARRTPLPHQVEAIDAWKRRGRRGILEHATGSGKSFTAITAIHEHLQKNLPVLVLVPTELLLKQWYKEVKAEFGEGKVRILLAGGGHSSWKRADVVEGYTSLEGGPRLTVATLQTAASPEFHQRVQHGDHLFLLIDEVHRAGSPAFSQVFSIEAGPRMGLSATPRRYGDADGTARIYTYFDGVVEPPFTLGDAIAAGRLCRYNYHIHPTELSEQETNEWRSLTEEVKRTIARSRDRESGKIIPSQYLQMLLIRRARILKNASSKVSLAVEVLQQHYEDGDRWLVYCDNQSQLRAVLEALSAAGFLATEYHSAMLGDRDTTLHHFSTVGGILVAIKCLDEGVDIPAVDHALILASSKNPREFIQRRGRVLRVAPGKFFAEIHDALVVPPAGDPEPDDVAILRGEIARSMQFAQNAANDAVMFQLRRLARDFDIDPDGRVALAGFEDEEADE